MPMSHTFIKQARLSDTMLLSALQYEDGISGPARVWLSDMDIPGLAMSRSIGDTVAHSAGVISEPERIQYALHAADKMIIVASDGLWEFMTSQQVGTVYSQVRTRSRAVKITQASCILFM